MLFVRTYTRREIPVSLCGVTYQGVLAIVTDNISIPEAAEIFSNKLETEHLEYINQNPADSHEKLIDTYEGYTVLDSVGLYYGAENRVHIRLRKPVSG